MAAFDPLGALIIIAETLLEFADVTARGIVRGYQACRLYGLSGIPLSIFGNRTTWRIQAQILGHLRNEDALAYKESVYNECTMIAVAVRIPLKALCFILADIYRPQL
jgi:hypothetical protein